MTTETVAPEYSPKGWRTTTTGRKTIVSTASRIVSAISFGVFWRFAPSTSVIIRSKKVCAALRGDLRRRSGPEHLGAAGDRRAVAAGLADHRSGLARDRGLVDRRDPLDDLAVGGDEVARLADDAVALCKSPAATRLSVPSGLSRRAAVSERILRNVSAWALPRPSAIASAKFAKITVSKSQTVIDQVKVAAVRDRLDEGDDACRRARRTSQGS